MGAAHKQPYGETTSIRYNTHILLSSYTKEFASFQFQDACTDGRMVFHKYLIVQSPYSCSSLYRKEYASV